MIGDRTSVQRSTKLLNVSAIVALVALITLRLSGPSDLYDQTQPKTIAYTTDIIVHGGLHWLLPLERGELPATKPPLYNWLAVPGVMLLGFHSEIGHKLPSIAAMLACWLILARMRTHGAPEAASTGGADLAWLSALVFTCNYAIFKLGYLVRPDMLLTLWMLIAWWSATRLFQQARAAADSLVLEGRCTRNAYAIMFWLAVTLAALTKGPVAVLAVIYAVIAARGIGGRWREIHLLHPVVGSLFAMAVFCAWVFAVWRINPDHLHQELWFNEIYGRVTGTGSEGTHHGSREFLRELPYQTFYFLTRFAPWSLFAGMGMLALGWRWIETNRKSKSIASRTTRTGETGSSEPAAAPETDPSIVPRAAAWFIVLTIAAFSLSVGKRADYVAIAIPQASILAAWHLLKVRPHIGMRLPWLAPITAAVTLAALSYYDHQQIWAPQPGFGDAVRAFVDDSASAISNHPATVFNTAAGQTYVQAALGIAAGDQRQEIVKRMAEPHPFWVISSRTKNAPHEFDEWAQQRRFAARVVPVVRSRELPRAAGWPGQMTLWRVEPE